MKIRKSISLSSDITDVCVYRNSALITRECTYESELESYEQQFKIIGLPLCLEDDSVKVSLMGEDKHSYINNISVIVEENTREPEFDHNDKRKSLNKRRISLQSKYLNLENEKKLLVTGPNQKNKPREFNPQKALKSRIAHLAFIEERKSVITEEMAELSEKIRFIDEEIVLLEYRGRSETGIKKSAVFTACNFSAGKLRFTLTYEVKGPCWCPSYSLRLNGEMDKAELQFKAVVSQNTGEDWNGVNLTVSTGYPRSYRKLPEFKSLHLGRAQSQSAKSSWQPPPLDTGKLFSDWNRFKKSEPLTASSVSNDTLYDLELSAAECTPMPVAGAAAIPDAEPPLLPPVGALPPPAAAPMPSPAVMKEPVRSNRSFKAKKKISNLSRSSEEITACEFEEQEEIIEVVSAADVSRYEKLRMASPGMNKGKLIIAEKSVIYQEMLTVSYHEVVNLISESIRESKDASCPNNLKVGGGYNFIFHSAVPVDVESSPTNVTVALFTEKCTAEMHYLAVPREAPDFFRSLKFMNPTDLPMLAGPVDVYVDSVFLMTVEMKQTPSGGDVEISMGVEQGIKLSRNTDFEESHKGLMKGSNALNHNIVNEVTNTLHKEVHIEIQERLPVPEKDEKNISVDCTGCTPQWQKIPEDFKEEDVKDKGLYHWQAAVPPGESAEFSYSYTISLPAKEEIVGGNRREF